MPPVAVSPLGAAGAAAGVDGLVGVVGVVGAAGLPGDVVVGGDVVAPGAAPADGDSVVAPPQLASTTPLAPSAATLGQIDPGRRLDIVTTERQALMTQAATIGVRHSDDKLSQGVNSRMYGQL